MNVSGPSIADVYRKAFHNPTNMVVVSDSVQHDVTKLAIRMGGSANGHNGIKSIISALRGEQNFWRFRAGIGYDGTDMSTYVLGRLSNHEKQFWNDEGLDLVLEGLGQVTRSLVP